MNELTFRLKPEDKGQLAIIANLVAVIKEENKRTFCTLHISKSGEGTFRVWEGDAKDIIIVLDGGHVDCGAHKSVGIGMLADIFCQATETLELTEACNPFLLGKIRSKIHQNTYLWK